MLKPEFGNIVQHTGKKMLSYTGSQKAQVFAFLQISASKTIRRDMSDEKSFVCTFCTLKGV
jgi:hypothetical protein